MRTRLPHRRASRPGSSNARRSSRLVERLRRRQEEMQREQRAARFETGEVAYEQGPLDSSGEVPAQGARPAPPAGADPSRVRLLALGSLGGRRQPVSRGQAGLASRRSSSSTHPAEREAARLAGRASYQAESPPTRGRAEPTRTRSYSAGHPTLPGLSTQEWTLDEAVAEVGEDAGDREHRDGEGEEASPIGEQALAPQGRCLGRHPARRYDQHRAV